MPYADREKQLSYMRDYMKTRRIINRIAKLKKRKADLLHQFETEPEMKYFIKREEVGVYCDQEIERLEGLLKNCTNSSILGGTP